MNRRIVQEFWAQRAEARAASGESSSRAEATGYWGIPKQELIDKAPIFNTLLVPQEEPVDEPPTFGEVWYNFLSEHDLKDNPY